VKDEKFKVDLSGIIDLLSEHIYSTPGVFIRELLQNATDAISAVKIYKNDFTGEVNVNLRSTPYIGMEITDNGIGLTKEEISQFLTVVGQSSKRFNQFQDDFIGKFGVGLLSAFVVSKEITIKTRSEYDEYGYIWVAKSDGTYTIEQLSEVIPVGTSVLLTAKPEMLYYFQEKTINELLFHYGEALPYPIRLISDGKEKSINTTSPVWLNPNSKKEELIKYGEDHFKQKLIDAFPVSIEELGLQGTAFITAQKHHFHSTNESKVFVKRMLLSEKINHMLPKWCFFIKLIINTDELSPTASREDFIQDSTYKMCKELLGSIFEDYLKTTMRNNTPIFRKILDVHYESIKMLAKEDNSLMEHFMDFLVFETTKGRRNFKWIKENIDKIYYTNSLEDYKQVKRTAHSKGLFIINAAYSFEEPLIEKIKKKHTSLDIQLITPFDVLKDFETLSKEEQLEYKDFTKKAADVMDYYFCDVEIRKFFPSDIPVLFIGNKESINNYQIEKIAKDKNNPFASILDTSEKKEKPLLCFNSNNSMIKKLFKTHEKDLFSHMVKIIYIQSLFIGQYPVNKPEMELLNLSLSNILDS